MSAVAKALGVGEGQSQTQTPETSANPSSSNSATDLGSKPAAPGHAEPGRGVLGTVGRYLHTDIDTKACNAISIYACFLTGFTSAPSFSACYVWCGFQTGNVAQLGLAVARCFAEGDYRTFGFQKPDQQAFCSLLSFLIGTSLGRIGDRIGAKRRTWLCGVTFVQVLMAMAAAICAHYTEGTGVALERGDPAWQDAVGFAALGFISASMGVQGIVGKRIASPMNTTVVLTTTWVELFNDPFLFALRAVPSRDIRALGVFSVFMGSFFSRAILQSSAGQAGALGVLAGLRLLQVVWFIFIKPAGKSGTAKASV